MRHGREMQLVRGRGSRRARWRERENGEGGEGRGGGEGGAGTGDGQLTPALTAVKQYEIHTFIKTTCAI